MQYRRQLVRHEDCVKSFRSSSCYTVRLIFFIDSSISLFAIDKSVKVVIQMLIFLMSVLAGYWVAWLQG